MVATQPMQLV